MIQINNFTKIGLVVLGLAIAASLAWHFFDFKNQDPGRKQISGEIIEVRENSITVSGLVKATKSTRQEIRTITFQITEDTDFNKTAWIIDTSSIKPGEEFSPPTKEMEGSRADLKVHTKILRLKSKEDLFTTEAATALEINYIGFEYKYAD